MSSGDDARRRVLQALSSEPPPSSDETESDSETETIDLNDEQNLIKSGLEDPTLQDHMGKARDRLAAHEKSLSHLPALIDLRSKYLKSMGTMSTMYRLLKDKCMDISGRAEVMHSFARATEMLKKGRRSHLLKTQLTAAAAMEPSVIQALTSAEKKAKQIADDYDTTKTTVESFCDELFKLRRDVEEFGDNMLALIETLQEDLQAHREYLAMATRANKG